MAKKRGLLALTETLKKRRTEKKAVRSSLEIISKDGIQAVRFNKTLILALPEGKDIFMLEKKGILGRQDIKKLNGTLKKVKLQKVT